MSPADIILNSLALAAAGYPDAIANPRGPRKLVWTALMNPEPVEQPRQNLAHTGHGVQVINHLGGN